MRFVIRVKGKAERFVHFYKRDLRKGKGLEAKEKILQEFGAVNERSQMQESQ